MRWCAARSSAAVEMLGRIFRRFTELRAEREPLQAQIDALQAAPVQPADFSLLDQLPLTANPLPRLTPRQTDLLHLVGAGYTNTQIARHLGISEGTVRTHLENIYERLHVSSRTAAVTRAFADRVA